MSPKKYDEKLANAKLATLKEKRHDQKIKTHLQTQAERARFEAKTKGERPKLYISYGFSDLDPFTNIEFAWDLWVKFPFKVPKEQCEAFKEAIQDAFSKIFLD